MSSRESRERARVERRRKRAASAAREQEAIDAVRAARRASFDDDEHAAAALETAEALARAADGSAGLWCRSCDRPTVRRMPSTPVLGQPGLHILRYRSVSVAIDAEDRPFACARCGRLSLHDDAATAAAEALWEAADGALASRARRALAMLDGVVAVTRLEELLHVSRGYLAKVRAGRVTPGAQVVGLLGLLAADPRRLVELEALWSEDAERSERGGGPRAAAGRDISSA